MICSYLRTLFRPLSACVFAAVVAAPGMGRAQCAGDCNGDGTVGINELIAAVNAALGTGEIEDCPGLDTDDSGIVEIGELIRAVNHALGGCPPPEPTATPTPTVADPTATPLPPAGPDIVLTGITTADDRLVEPTLFEDGIPVYTVPQGRSFHLVIESAPGLSGLGPGADTFNANGPPSFQIQSSRPLGNGSVEVCDGEAPIPGGVPAIAPPSFASTQAIQDALNDFGCRFDNGGDGETTSGRSCGRSFACIRFDDGVFGCAHPDTSLQYCSNVITVNEEFPVGDTLLSVRVLENPKDRLDPQPGPVAQMVIRVSPPLPSR